jgi:putative FmdB family regulatory protein
MPIYAYHCDYCGHDNDEYHKMHESPLLTCPKCGHYAPYHKVPTLSGTDLKEFHTPIELYSVAMETDQEIREFKAKCPDVEVATDPHDPMYGVPIARSRKQKLQALEASGFVETN